MNPLLYYLTFKPNRHNDTYNVYEQHRNLGNLNLTNEKYVGSVLQDGVCRFVKGFENEHGAVDGIEIKSYSEMNY